MSERERYIALADLMTDEQVTEIINVVLAHLLKCRMEDERDRQIAAECENIYQRYKADPASEEFVTLDELMDSLGLTEEDIRGGDPQ